MRARSPSAAFLLAGSVFASGLGSGALAGRAAVARAQDPYSRLDLFARVFATVRDDYVEEVSAEELVDAAIVGMVKALDSQSRWLDEEQLAGVRTDTTGAAPGLGLEVARESGAVAVTAVTPGSPAERHGLRPGDRLLSVDGRATADLPLPELEKLLGGERGATAILEVTSADGTARTVAAPRDLVHREIVRGERLATPEGDVIYTRLVQFQDGAAADLDARVRQLAEAAGGFGAVRGLVLDLRDDPGGLLDEAVGVMDLFLDEGPIVSTRGRAGEPEVHLATPGGFPPDLALAVLVNGMSASASEIVAGAVQDTRRGVVVGERTYGKGTVQQVYVHAEDAALKLTVGRYYTPSGAPVATKEGRVPDVVVPWPVRRTAKEELDHRIRAVPGLPDDERERMLELLGSLPDPKPNKPEIPWDVPASARLPDDPQLAAAIAALAR